MRNGIDMIVRNLMAAGFTGHSHERNPRAKTAAE